MANPMRSSSPFLLPLLLLLLLVAALSRPAAATDHIVGGHLGWNPNVNYTPWINNQTFYVNDFISFRYQKNMYNVFMVNQTGYDNCTTEGAEGNWTSGKDFILLTVPKRYYFICGNGYCLNGMKVSIVVHPLPSPLASPSQHSKPNSTNAGAALSSPSSYSRALAGVVAAALVGFAGLVSV